MSVNDLLLSRDARLLSYFQPEPITSMVKAHQAGKEDHGRRIWSLLMLEAWMRSG